MNLRRLRAQTALELRLLLRNGENLLVTLGVPLGMLVFFTLVPVLPTAGREPLDILVPGALTVAVMGSAMVALGISTAFEREHSVLRRYGVTPLRRGELVGAKALAVLVIVVVQATAVTGAAAALGWRPGLTPGGVAAAGLALLLATCAFAGIGLAIAGRLPAMGALAMLNGVFLLLVLLGGVAVPLAEMPDWLAAFGGILPTAWAAGTLSTTLTSTGPPVVAGLSALAGWAVVASVVAARTFRWE